MIRLLPLRQYNEHDVVPFYALADEYINEKLSTTGSGDAGVFVSVASGDFNKDPIEYSTDSYLGKTDYPFVGAAQYPKVPLKLKPAGTGDAVLGLTLKQTAKYDENDEKLLYYPQKALENHAVLPGQAVPVVTRGIFQITAAAINGSLTVGGGFKISSGAANAGKVTGCALDDALKLGVVIGTGSRTAQTTSNAGSTERYAGNFAVIKLG